MVRPEQKVVNIFLEKGVVIPVTTPFLLRIFTRRKQLAITLPRIDVLMKIADLWLSIGKDTDNELSLLQSLEMVAKDAKTVSEIVAWAIVNNPKLGWLVPVVAKRLRRLTANELMQLYQMIVLYGGLEDFINTIRLVEQTRITLPMIQSPAEKMS